MQEVQQFADKVAQTCASQVESAWFSNPARKLEANKKASR